MPFSVYIFHNFFKKEKRKSIGNIDLKTQEIAVKVCYL